MTRIFELDAVSQNDINEQFNIPSEDNVGTDTVKITLSQLCQYFFNQAGEAESSPFQNFSIAIGGSNSAADQYCTVVGYSSSGDGSRSTSVGYGNEADNINSSAIGYQNTANNYGEGEDVGTGWGASAIGYRNQAQASQSSAFGHKNNALSRQSSAFGNNKLG